MKKIISLIITAALMASVAVPAFAWTYKRALVTDVTNTTKVIIPAVTGKRIKVYGYRLVSQGTSSIAFRDGVTGDQEGLQVFTDTGFVENVNPPTVLFSTASGTALYIKTGPTGTWNGIIRYWDDDAY